VCTSMRMPMHKYQSDTKHFGHDRKPHKVDRKLELGRWP
jgi:hypothetical protein